MLAGQFVEVGEPGLRYWIVAAGTARLGSNEQLYSGLRIADVSPDGVFMITYNKYRFPDPVGPTRLVVKVLPVMKRDFAVMLIANFMEFLPNGFTVRVADASGTIRDQLRDVELMIEVSQYIRRG